MGLLDDAIREHLDLKRRSGGDPAEIERLEREALGRVRREPTAPAGTATPVTPVAPEYDPDDRSDEPGAVPRAEIVGSPTERQPRRRGFLHRRASPVDAPEPAAGVEQGERELDRHEAMDDPTSSAPFNQAVETEPPPLALTGSPDESSRSALTEPAEHLSPLDDPTVEHEAAHGFDEDDEYRAFEDEPDVDEDDDVLEETPEFLQDTPDHDRLWFEQRPPRDFDFDE